MSIATTEQGIKIAPDGLSGDLVVPERASGVVLFAHGSGSSRHSSRNPYVAGTLQQGGFGYLLLDFLTADAEEVGVRTPPFCFLYWSSRRSIARCHCLAAPRATGARITDRTLRRQYRRRCCPGRGGR